MIRFKQFLAEVFDSKYKWRWESETRAAFDNKQTKKVTVIFSPVDDDVEVLFSVANNYGITNNGDQFKIFATVIDIIFDYIKKHKPKRIEIESSKIYGRSRSNLYSKMIEKLIKTIPYKFEVKETNEYTTFWLIRK